MNEQSSSGLSRADGFVVPWEKLRYYTYGLTAWSTSLYTLLVLGPYEGKKIEIALSGLELVIVSLAVNYLGGAMVDRFRRTRAVVDYDRSFKTGRVDVPAGG